MAPQDFFSSKYEGFFLSRNEVKEREGPASFFCRGTR
jgi:hypothetical protein